MRRRHAPQAGIKLGASTSAPRHEVQARETQRRAHFGGSLGRRRDVRRASPPSDIVTPTFSEYVVCQQQVTTNFRADRPRQRKPSNVVRRQAADRGAGAPMRTCRRRRETVLRRGDQVSDIVTGRRVGHFLSEHGSVLARRTHGRRLGVGRRAARLSTARGGHRSWQARYLAVQGIRRPDQVANDLGVTSRDAAGASELCVLDGAGRRWRPAGQTRQRGGVPAPASCRSAST